MNRTEMAEVLDTAVEHLEKCPWGQGTTRLASERICAQDAIAMAVLGSKNWHDLTLVSQEERHALWLKEEQVIEYVANWYLGGTALFEWNDEVGRTKDEVLDLLTRVAKDLRNEATPE